LWRAVDQDGFELDILLQSRKNKQAAKRFFKKLLKGLCYAPQVIITDKLQSYGAAKKEILPGVEHRQKPTRQQEKLRRRFKSTKQAQWFLSIHSQIRNLFGAHRYKMAANVQREQLTSSWIQW
jgi:putative transposase